ncbi:23S rRNA (uracil(1939)-C(5))-methyltransferase RlmD [Rhizosphaericola mali]|uniref:23S rRNA (Uracil(1939)-C(5))-methyltransferase RlmD n=1 Tax=Rhizosphaericola mali TaxID=2545455 RepID=A0A5P2G6P5_9BACT|nr:23S rRNA (uracil(1939)-C(5))-methyltransferase RlmD [Rhizosphaericola mali]QES89612.1 23S rRNA (uracil(1939)-C(5))-methyltransferase RlmD [Rhizosphaericola mali]
MRRKKERIVLENVLVTDYAAEGKSLARVEGKVVFIENSIPGDIVNVQLSKNKKDFAEGFPLRVVQYSPERIEAFCTHFGICGGCSWQTLPYELQLKYKQQQVVDNLTRIGKIELPEIQPILGCGETQGYRNKMEYTFSTKKYIPRENFIALKEDNLLDNAQNEGAAGFHAKGFFDKVVEIEKCYLQEEPTNKIRNFVAAWGRENNIPFYNIKEHTGWLRNMMVRIATTGEIMINLVVGYEKKSWREEILGKIETEFPEITTILYTINEKKNDSIYDLEPKSWKGNGFIYEKLEHFKFKISPKSFFQTNTRQAEKLYQVVRDFAELDGSQVVYDLYCGTGSIGIFVSDKAKKIVGVEVIDDAIKDAKINAAENNVNDAVFFAGDVIKICDDAFFEEHGKPDIVITDPPRAGMHEKLVQKLLEMEVPEIVYVSCNPATQARDLALLDAKYQVIKVQPVDMFPHTLHIENVVKLKLKK